MFLGAAKKIKMKDLAFLAHYRAELDWKSKNITTSLME
jgi:hypothetical protein